jgi:putative membrane protein
VKERRATDRRELTKLNFYLLLAAVVASIAGAVVLASAGLVSSAEAADLQPLVADEEFRDLPADPGAADASGWAARPDGDGDEGCWGDGHMWGWDVGWWWLAMPIGMIIFWGGIIALVVWAIRQFTGGRGGVGHAVDIARTRYAKGEISREEFERLRRDLV